MKRFVPITDELIYDHPEDITAPLVPFSLDYACQRGLADKEQEDCSRRPAEMSMHRCAGAVGKAGPPPRGR
jgi:hypothetical protein